MKELDFARIVQGEQDLVKAQRHQKDEAVLPKLADVTVIDSRARFLDANTVAVNAQVLTAGKAIIATGSTAELPPVSTWIPRHGGASSCDVRGLFGPCSNAPESESESES